MQESGEMYLETIWILSQTSEKVRSLDVAEYMGYSKPSISRAVNLLKSGGYIEMDTDGSLSLTESGRKIATKMYERHTLLSSLLVRLGVDKETATRDACKIEHDLSDETFNAIKEYADKI